MRRKTTGYIQIDSLNLTVVVHDTFNAMSGKSTAQMLENFYRFVKRWAAERLELDTTLKTLEELRAEFLLKPR